MEGVQTWLCPLVIAIPRPASALPVTAYYLTSMSRIWSLLSNHIGRPICSIKSRNGFSFLILKGSSSMVTRSMRSILKNRSASRKWSQARMYHTGQFKNRYCGSTTLLVVSFFSLVYRILIFRISKKDVWIIEKSFESTAR